MGKESSKVDFDYDKKIKVLSGRQLICYPLRVGVRQISGLYEILDCPSDWFVGVAEEGATPTNQ